MAKSYVRGSNLTALKEAWENKNRRGGNFKFWKPIKFGRYTVRFLPPADKDGLFFYETAQYKLGENYYFAPYIEGDPDPVYEYYKALYQDGTPEAIAIAKEIKPRKQYLYNIVVRDELGEEPENLKQIHTYMSGKTLYEVVMDYFFDDDYGDLTDVEKGYDFVIVKEQGDLGFPNYKKSKPRKNPTPLFEDDEDVELVLKSIQSLRDQVEYKSYNELKEALQLFIDGAKSSGTLVESYKTEDKSSKTEEKTSKKNDEDTDSDDIDEFQSKLLAELEEDDE